MFFCKSKQTNHAHTVVVPEWAVSHAAWLRLEDQLSWYDTKSIYCQAWYKWLKFLQVVFAVGIPVFSHLDGEAGKWAVSSSGALIAVLEAIQHMNQYSTLWVMYRSTAERLKHEKYLFLSSAGPYRNLAEADRLIALAERVEEHVSTEHANWFNESRRTFSTSKREGHTGKTE